MQKVSIFARVLRKTSKKNLVKFCVAFGKYFENFKLIMSETIEIQDLLVRLTLMQMFGYRNIFLSGSSEKFIRNRTWM